MSWRYLFLFFLLWSAFADGAVIIKVKGRKALVDLEGVTAQVGDRFDALNLYGKSLGLLEIKKVKRGKAIAVLRKGKMGVNWILEPTSEQNLSEPYPSDDPSFTASNVNDLSKNTNNSTPPESFSSVPSPVSSPVSSPQKSLSIPFNVVGVELGPYYNWVRLSSSTTIAGMSWKAGGMLDFRIMDHMAARFTLGYQTLKVEGKDCSQIPRCKLVLHYPGVEFVLRGVFLKNTFRPWIGGGGSLFWPIVDKKNDLGLDPKSFRGFHGALTISFGLDIYLKSIYFPIQIKMGWINPVLISFQPVKKGTKEFKPTYIGIQTGLGVYF